jgi:CRP/FNR family cyclic AMP-dependent transcriptional regulator
MTLKDSLCAVELFCELPDDVVEELISHGSTLTAAAGVPLVTQGDPTSGLHMIIEGSAAVTVDGRPVGTLSVGDYFGEMSLIDGAPRSATITAGPDGATAFRLSPAAFTQLMEMHPHTTVLLLKGLVARVRRLEAERR